MNNDDMRYKQGCAVNLCATKQPSMQTIIVRQVLGEREEQKVFDMHVRVPERKPSIEQIVDVFVKNLKVTSVDVIMDRVIVRGEFELKTIYVANLPGNPVHALEIKHCKWTQDIGIAGARYGMDAEASVCMEFVDYDVPEMTRAYKYKYHGKDCCDSSSSSDGYGGGMGYQYKPKFNFKAPTFKKPQPADCGTGGMKQKMECMKECMGECMGECKKANEPCKPDCSAAVKPECKPDCKIDCAPPKPAVDCGLRDFDVAVILRVNAKVIVDREVQLNGGQTECNCDNNLPSEPKG